MLQKALSSFKSSVTILWARVVALVGAALAVVPSLTSDPNISNAIHTILRPEYIPYYVIGIGVITEMARRRTAGKT